MLPMTIGERTQPALETISMAANASPKGSDFSVNYAWVTSNADLALVDRLIQPLGYGS